MTNNGSVLADSIGHLKHLQAFDLLFKARFSAIQLDALLVYLIDTVNADAIPYLAEQFDVLGYKGFRLAQTEADQRSIIKRSIELHRYKGTLWAVKEALTSIGFGEAVIEENVAGPFTFRISIDLGGQPLNLQQIDDLSKMVDEYKNERSHLAAFSYAINFNDGVMVVDIYADGEPVPLQDSITAGGSFQYNGQHSFDGSRNFSTDTDVLTIQIR